MAMIKRGHWIQQAHTQVLHIHTNPKSWHCYPSSSCNLLHHHHHIMLFTLPSSIGAFFMFNFFTHNHPTYYTTYTHTHLYADPPPDSLLLFLHSPCVLLFSSPMTFTLFCVRHAARPSFWFHSFYPFFRRVRLDLPYIYVHIKILPIKLISRFHLTCVIPMHDDDCTLQWERSSSMLMEDT